MERLIKKYVNKLIKSGLVNAEDVFFAGIDEQIVWNRTETEHHEIFTTLFRHLTINSLLFSLPDEPYRTIINYLASKSYGAIYPKDCETRTFLHDLPVLNELDECKVVEALKRRKAVIIENKGIITYGTVSPEQAFVTYSSVCFSCFVKFFVDYYNNVKQKTVDQEQQAVFEKVIELLSPPLEDGTISLSELYRKQLTLTEDPYGCMVETGNLMVENRLVDSFFGNLSYCSGKTLYISQTGSSLDELNGCIDPCPMDDSSSIALTASSEFSAHRKIVTSTDYNVILHGHPKFSVIISMCCDNYVCESLGKCHIRCSRKRYLDDIPIVPGEVGTGVYGLCNTLPVNIKNNRGAIVYGHGLFSVGINDFVTPFRTMVFIENRAREAFFLSLKE
ncbi:MAG: rRNA adenine dimethylase [Candidatus Margulisiibacteriota bacterium]|nr:MAG: hypothetical protein A2X43_11225 [Candidatus Margulisbacteria bacterium GWD2_39_127]OGI02797.1 MAG: hypothetical protein A2X42_02050 [Candidatus Margulisbacteria bacterium GWF2_38_17]OGI09316.1 MAG: hypothetical protein A2X41_09325 [Candidatus Margulisbacteria bacterium GWE2_39_32]PZM77386.1 MAG: rRNA adenine dimethylase [Candidatus Margulisiibacteriota bacterium]HAR63965.1 rRNA adenine dimethylase [Candidatus Margulisiibacteriota bacterium]